MVFIAKLSRDKFAFTIQAPGEFRAKFIGNYDIFRTGDFESLFIRERRISPWRKPRKRPGKRSGRSLEQRAERRWAAEVGSEGWEPRLGAEVESGGRERAG